MNSGLYKSLTRKKLLISHREVSTNKISTIIQPKKIPFISYPYEWCFSAFKDAAILTLEIQKKAMHHGMVLKDASSYNIQFLDGKPILIDSLSFETYEEGAPWVAYRQYCQHFLAPLSLMNNRDIRLNKLLTIYLDGIPLDLASGLLPKSTYTNFGLLSHIHLHARSQSYFSEKTKTVSSLNLNKNSLKRVIDNLENTIKKLKIKTPNTQWKNYYNFTNYTKTSFKHKLEIVSKFIKRTKTRNTIIDYGANTGLFSEVATKLSQLVVSVDSDPMAIELNYQNVKQKKLRNALPLIVDLTNPSPAIGWQNTERDSFVDRSRFDIGLALAIIHHMYIGNNLSFDLLAKFFSKMCRNLIIEFIPKDDSQFQKLIANRNIDLSSYTKESFENTFSKYFKIASTDNIEDSKRTLYLLQNTKEQL
jgi:2-polyprenyl-3-methyl-5-hydroxy-6-metoxy-1,4-benzoquinol methylase